VTMAPAFPSELIESAREAGQDDTDARFYEWLAEEAGPEDWHRFALDCNWGAHDPALYEWIASQPSCDRATALVLFWKASPEYQLENGESDESSQPEEAELLDLIRKRWLAGAFVKADIAFDHDADVWPVDFAALDERYGDLAKTLLPMEMRIAHLPGRRLSVEDCIEGIPKRFWPEELWYDHQKEAQ
jgi:hypothetical protein